MTGNAHTDKVLAAEAALRRTTDAEVRSKRTQQHTPGPWHIGERHPSRVIADVAEDLANARLIAAAPELLTALEACDRLASCQSDLSLAMGAVRTLARAALAKAKG